MISKHHTSQPSADTLRDSELRLARDVRFRRLADEAVVIRQDVGEVLVVNELGARVLELLDEQEPATADGASGVERSTSSFASLVAVLQCEYTPNESLDADVLAFLGELLDAGVVGLLPRDVDVE